MSLERIARTLRETSGLEAGSLGEAHFADAVGRLVGHAGVDLGRYADLVAADAGVRERLTAELLVHETSFFRYPGSFPHLAEHAVRCAGARPGPVRVLSVACATGQEPYSVAISLREAGIVSERIVVHAFDRSPSAIETARAGHFDRGGARGLDAARASRWFVRDGRGLALLPEVRALVQFGVGSVLDDDRPFAGAVYDAVLCRNLLIYLTEPARRRALAVLRASLVPGGVLYLGHAEVLVARNDGFAPIAQPGTYACVAKPPDAAAPPPKRAALPIGNPVPSVPPPPPASVPTAAPVRAARAPSASAAPDILVEAQALADRGRLTEALALLEAEVTRGRPGADHFHLLALVRRATGRAREADEALGRALYLDPRHVGALLLAAVAAEGRGERDVAMRLHARARSAVEGTV